MKFLLDMPVSPALVEWLKTKGHEAVHAIHLGLYQASDTELVEWARRENRVIITADLDFSRLLVRKCEVCWRKHFRL